MSPDDEFRVQIEALDNEIANILRAKVINEVKVSDVEVSTGNPSADGELAQAANQSKVALAMQARMLEVRKTKLASLISQRSALQTTPQPASQV